MNSRRLNRVMQERAYREARESLRPFQLDELGPIPVVQIARHHGLTDIRESAESRSVDSEQIALDLEWGRVRRRSGRRGRIYISDGPDVDPTLVVDPSQPRSSWRFTVAHELAHLVFSEKAEELEAIVQEGNTQKDAGIENFCNEFASYFLLPDALLERWLAKEDVGEEGLEAVERACEHLEVSTQHFVKRVAEVLYPGPEDWLLFTADKAVARKARSGFALRVRTRVTPNGFEIFFNRRLTSIGLGSVAQNFEDVDPYVEYETEVDIELVDRDNWKESLVPINLTWKKYSIRSDYSYMVAFGKIAE